MLNICKNCRYGKATTPSSYGQELQPYQLWCAYNQWVVDENGSCGNYSE